MSLLPREPRFVGATQYIDGVRVADLGGAPAALGVDVHGRSFVSFVVEHGGKRRVATLFQRYTGPDGLWAIAGALPMSGALHEGNREIVRALCSEAGHKFGSCFSEDGEEDDERWRAALVA